MSNESVERFLDNFIAYPHYENGNEAIMDKRVARTIPKAAFLVTRVPAPPPIPEQYPEATHLGEGDLNG